VRPLTLSRTQVINLLCSLGQFEKMYMPPILDEKVGILANQVLYEQQVARTLGLKPGAHVLDVGCGRGRVAASIASYSGAHVTGLNIEPTQIENARAHAKRQGLEDQLQFVIGSYNEYPLPFADESFDAAYDMLALSYVKDLDRFFREMYRVLKPGATFSLVEWVAYDYDPNDPEHVEILKKTKAILGASKTVPPGEWTSAMQRAGFVVCKSDQASVPGNQFKMLRDNAESLFIGLGKFVSGLVRVRLLPRHMKVLLDRLNEGGDALVEGDKRNLFTMSHEIVAEKPNKGNVK
jgi:sterol 24-C-methyltransferase